MSKRDIEMESAPSCPHDDMELFRSGSPVGGAFAPGVLDEDELAGMQFSKAEHLERSDPGAPGENPDLPSEEKTTEEENKLLEVLVVHPSPGVQRQVALALGDLGFEVTSCGDVDRALDRVLLERPDAVVAEIGDPHLDALDLCRRIADRRPGTPVVLVAQPDDEAHCSLAMECGAADYLRRPLTPQFMADRLRAAIEKARASGRLHGASEAAEARLLIPEKSQGHLSRQLRREELKVQSLFELSRNVFGSLELEELYHGMLLTAMGQLGIGAGVLYHLDVSAAGRVVGVASRGIPTADAKRLLDFRAGLAAFLLRHPRPVLLAEGLCPHELRRDVEELRRSGLAIACPMASKGSPVGVALFGPKLSGEPFSDEDLLLLSAVCNFAGPSLESARLYTDLHLTYLSTVRAFVSSLEAKDTYTRGHSERVADYARSLAQVFGYKRNELDMVVFGAMLHDIGKIGVAEGILNKPGPLTQEEWQVVRAHPEMGARIVSHIDYLAPAVGLILHHHERIDGRGYPHGLEGDDIEFGARIVTVVDSFDAMTTDRPYRRAMDENRAVKLLRSHAGRQFDHQVVEAFVGLLESGAITRKT